MKSCFRNQSTSAIASLLVLCMISGYPSSALGQSIEPSGDSIYSESGNLVVGASATGTLTLSGGTTLNATTGQIGLAAGSFGQVSVADAGSRLTITGTDSFWIGGSSTSFGGTGRLQISNGANVVATGATRLGYFPGSVGIVDISGTSSSGAASFGYFKGGLIVGDIYGYGVVNINNGGAARVDGTYGDLIVGNDNASTGYLTVSGSGSSLYSSTYILVGRNASNIDSLGGTGTFTVNNGAAVTSTNSLIIGLRSGGTGTLNVSGTGTTVNVTAGDLSIGSDGGTGTATISDGANVRATEIGVGAYNGGTLLDSLGQLIVDGATTVLEAFDGGMEVGGDGGQGTVQITHGAHLITQGGEVGAETGSGSVTIDGVGSTWTSSEMIMIGGNGSGELKITNGGTLTTAGALVGLSYDGGSGSGIVSVSGTGSSWTNSGGFNIGGYQGDEGLAAGTGTLIIRNGGIVNADGDTSTVTLGVYTGAVGTLSLGGSTGQSSAAGGVLNASTVTTGPGSGFVRFNTTATSSAPYYFTRDGTASGTGVSITGVTQVVNEAGVTVLTSANTYTGGTTIAGGTLLANNTTGSALGTGNVLVSAGATLGGSGSIGGWTTIADGGRLAAGASIGTLTFTAGLTFESGSVLKLDLGTISDLVVVSGGTVTGSSGLGGVTLDIQAADGFGAATYDLISGVSFSDFSASDFQIGSAPSGYTYSLLFSGSTLSLAVATSASAVPEPSTWAGLVGLIALGVAVLRRRRSHA